MRRIAAMRCCFKVSNQENKEGHERFEQQEGFEGEGLEGLHQDGFHQKSFEGFNHDGVEGVTHPSECLAVFAWVPS